VKEWGFAIVGGGTIFPWHSDAIASIANAKVRAVVDLVPEVAERRAVETGATAYTSLDQALARDDVDVVTVCVASGLHADVGVRAAAAGKHLLVEKPIEISLAAADRLIEACDRAGVGLSVVSQHRYDPGPLRLREAIEAGRLGRLILGDAVVKWYRTQEYFDSAGWRGTWAMDGGGALINQAVHYVDLLLWMMGPVRRVFARCRTAAHQIEVEDLAIALVEFENGAVGSLVASTAVYPALPERLEVTGTEGTVVVEMGEIRAWELKDERGETGPYGRKAQWAEPLPSPSPQRWLAHRAQIADFLDALENGRRPPNDGVEARNTLELILAVYESARTGREIDLPPAPGASRRLAG
jgi:predicted dehydrogenase